MTCNAVFSTRRATALLLLALAPAAFAVSPVNPVTPGLSLPGSTASPAQPEAVIPGFLPQLSAPVDNSQVFLINAFTFTGNTLLTDQQLQILLVPVLNRTFTVTQLAQIAGAVTVYYRQLGYSQAVASIRPERIQGNTLPVDIAEGHYGKIKVSGDSRLGEARIRARLQAIRSGERVLDRELQHDLLLLGDVPGVKVSSAFSAGTEPGVPDFTVTVEDTARLTGSVDFDNTGSVFFGRNEFGGSLAVNNPTGVGDQLSLNVLTSDEDFNFLQTGYSLPLGATATRLGVSFAHSDYRLGQALRVFGAEGDYDAVSVSLTQPFRRSATVNVYSQLGFDYKNTDLSFNLPTLAGAENAGITQTRQDRLRILTASLLANRREAGGALDSFGLTWHQGLGDVLNGLPGAGDPDTSSRPQATGDFSRLSLDLRREQALGRHFSLALHATAQLSTAPLVSAEQFTLGGPSGVRAYSFVEALGDEGYLLSAQLDWAPHARTGPVFAGKSLGEVLKLSAFYDLGETSLNSPCRNPALPEGGSARVCEDASHQLSGAGLGLSLDWPDNFSLKASYAWQTGNSAQVEKDYDQRLLVQIVKSF